MYLQSTERALINLDNGYFLPAVKLEAYICKTNMASNTVFRGTGAPQAAFIMEKIIDHVALYLNKDPVQASTLAKLYNISRAINFILKLFVSQIRRLNMYSEGDVTPYGQVLINSTIRRCWDECLRLSKYYEQKSEVDEFNRCDCMIFDERNIC
jgi:xanthine dehydrogenase/oxidase